MSNQKIVDFIVQSLTKGQSKEAIYKDLLIAGWSLAEIEEGYNSSSGAPLGVNVDLKFNKVKSVERAKETTADLGEAEPKNKVRMSTTNILVVIGAFLIGLGVFSFIASNWRGMDDWFKLFVILFFMNLSYWSGYYLKHTLQLQKSGNALLLLGTIIYGAGIFLVGQIFHIRANWADGFVFWMFGIWVVAWAEQMRPLLYYALILGVISVLGFPFIATGMLADDTVLGFSAFLLLVATIISYSIAQSYRRKLDPELAKLY